MFPFLEHVVFQWFNYVHSSTVFQLRMTQSNVDSFGGFFVSSEDRNFSCVRLLQLWKQVCMPGKRHLAHSTYSLTALWFFDFLRFYSVIFHDFSRSSH